MATLAESSFLRKLGFHIRASYPFITVVTKEVSRLSEEIETLASGYLSKEAKGDKKFSVYRWNCVDGWTAKGKKIPMKTQEGEVPSNNPNAAFQMIQDLDPYSLFILMNFHFYMTRDNPELIQLVHNLAPHCSQKSKTVIFANVTSDMPSEVEPLITVLNHDLPTVTDIVRAMDLMSESVKGRNVKLDFTESEKYQLVEAMKGMRLGDIEDALAYSIVTTKTYDPKVLMAAKCNAIKRIGSVQFVDSTESFETIGGLERLKRWISRWKVTLTDKAKKFHLRPLKALMLVGVPGCGKSLISKAISNAFGLPLYRFDPGSVLSKFVGDSEQNMSDALMTADAVAPCVFWVDEFEKGFAGVGSSGNLDSGVMARTGGKFLQWMNDHTSPVIIVATSNNLDAIPPEYLRKGRFNEIFFVDVPTEKERADVFLKQFVRHELKGDQYDIGSLVTASAGFTGAEIEAAIEGAQVEAAIRDEPPSTKDILDELGAIIPETKKNKAKIDTIRARAAQIAIPANDDPCKDPAEVNTKDGPWRQVQV